MLASLVRPTHVVRAVRTIHQSATRYAINVRMPSLSPTMTSGTIVKWNKKEGETVTAGDVLAEIQTDKAVVALEADEDGVLAKILVQADTEDVQVGKFIAVVAEDGEDWKDVEIPAESAVPSAPTSSADAAPPAPPAPSPAKPKYDINMKGEHHISHLMGPSVRLLLHEYGINATQIKPSGAKDQLTKADVLAFVKANNLQPVHKSKPSTASASTPAAPSATKPAPAATAPKPPPAVTADPSGRFSDIELSNMRKVIAKRLTQSKQQVPHAYATDGIRMNDVMKLRKQLKADGVNVTVNDFIVKASAAALTAVPSVDSQWKGGTIQWQPTVDVSVAVATPSGLITPIVHNADALGIAAIADKVRELAGRAKENKLQLHEFQGGSFTVSNLGMMGITEFTAIINPPQAAILAIGGAIPVMKPDLSFDNVRVVSGAEAARWLTVFRASLETPELLLTIDPESPFSTARFVSDNPPPTPVDPETKKLSALL